jgi:hypothetical protein
MPASKLNLYNKALMNAGQRKLSTETDAIEGRYKLDTIWDLGAVEYCLDIAKPFWSTVVVRLNSPSSPTDKGFSFSHPLPAAYLTIEGVYSDANLDQPISRYIIEGREILTDHSDIYLRYISNTHVTSFTSWTPNFAQLVSDYLAMELASSITPQKVESLTATFDQTVERVIQIEGIKENTPRSTKPGSDLSLEWQKIYNVALQIMGLPEITSGDDDSNRRVKLDVALEGDLVLKCHEETRWQFASVTDKIIYNPSIEPDWGYRYAFDKPPALIRTIGVFADEYQQTPLVRYQEYDGRWYADLTEIFVHYVSNADVSTPAAWPPFFKDYVAAEMARRAAPSLASEGARLDNALAEYERIRNQALNVDIQESPPQKIAHGNWTRSRWGYGGRSNDRP